VISPTGSPPPEIPSDWISVSLGDSGVLYCHPDLRLQQFKALNSRAIILGIVVDSKKRTELLEESEIECDLSFVERLDNLSGTYCALRLTSQNAWIYTDPSALMGIYYSPTYVSSTPSLIFDRIVDDLLRRTSPLKGTDDWYTGSTTPFSNVKMLLANHRLDLSSRDGVRFWPREEFPLNTYQDSIETIASHLRGTLSSVADAGKCVLSLTGGHDSRVNLAAARENAERIQFFTIVGQNIKKCDQAIPKVLADKYSLNYRAIEDSGSDSLLLDRYDEISSGMAMGARRGILNACQTIGGNGVIHINGNLGAITKRYFWHNSNPTEVKSKQFMKAFMSASDVIVSGIAEWMSSVPDISPPSIYNLMYLEQRGGKWMSPGENASNLFYESVAPFNSREIFASVCGMPCETQSKRNVLRDLVEVLWPDLLTVPFCPQTRKLSAFFPKKLVNLVKNLER
jgi:hypothetical protein